ncbi:mCG1031616, partial [Mus musculus]
EAARVNCFKNRWLCFPCWSSWTQQVVPKSGTDSPIEEVQNFLQSGSVDRMSTNHTEPVWVPEGLVQHCQNEEADLARGEHVSAPDGCGTQMGDTVSVSSSS